MFSCVVITVCSLQPRVLDCALTLVGGVLRRTPTSGETAVFLFLFGGADRNVPLAVESRVYDMCSWRSCCCRVVVRYGGTFLASYKVLVVI